MPTIFQSPSKSPKKRASSDAHTQSHPSTLSMLSCYTVRPTNVRFETQEPDEEVILFMRQHIVVNVPWIVITILLLLAPTIFFPLLGTFLHLPIVIPVGYIIVGTLFWYVATFGFALMNFLHWYFNIYIITNERAVDIDFVQLLYKRFSEAQLEKIQDISYQTSGVVAAFFDYGNVYIQTAGELPNFEFLAVPHPDRVVATISELTEQKKKDNL